MKMPASLVVEDSAILKFVNLRAEQRCSPETLDEDCLQQLMTQMTDVFVVC
jgi:hypothetical protein